MASLDHNELIHMLGLYNVSVMGLFTRMKQADVACLDSLLLGIRL